MEKGLKIDFESITRDVPRYALQESWSRLAPFVCDAVAFRKQAAESPELLRDPSILLHVRFLDEFEPELAALQAIYEASRVDTRFPTDDIRIGQLAVDRLFEITQQAQERILQQ